MIKKLDILVHYKDKFPYLFIYSPLCYKDKISYLFSEPSLVVPPARKGVPADPNFENECHHSQISLVEYFKDLPNQIVLNC